MVELWQSSYDRGIVEVLNDTAMTGRYGRKSHACVLHYLDLLTQQKFTDELWTRCPYWVIKKLRKTLHCETYSSGVWLVKSLEWSFPKWSYLPSMNDRLYRNSKVISSRHTLGLALQVSHWSGLTQLTTGPQILQLLPLTPCNKLPSRLINTLRPHPLLSTPD